MLLIPVQRDGKDHRWLELVRLKMLLTDFNLNINYELSVLKSTQDLKGLKMVLVQTALKPAVISMTTMTMMMIMIMVMIMLLKKRERWITIAMIMILNASDSFETCIPISFAFHIPNPDDEKDIH